MPKMRAVDGSPFDTSPAVWKTLHKSISRSQIDGLFELYSQMTYVCSRAFPPSSIALPGWTLLTQLALLEGWRAKGGLTVQRLD